MATVRLVAVHLLYAKQALSQGPRSGRCLRRCCQTYIALKTCNRAAANQMEVIARIRLEVSERARSSDVGPYKHEPKINVIRYLIKVVKSH